MIGPVYLVAAGIGHTARVQLSRRDAGMFVVEILFDATPDKVRAAKEDRASAAHLMKQLPILVNIIAESL